MTKQIQNEQKTSRAKSFCFMHEVKGNNYFFVHFFKYNSSLINNSFKFSWVSLDTHQYNTMQVNSNDMKILQPYKICIIKLTPNGWGKWNHVKFEIHLCGSDCFRLYILVYYQLNFQRIVQCWEYMACCKHCNNR